jgi:hypothetical protein
MISPASDGPSPFVMQAFRIVVPWVSTTDEECPVNNTNRDAWTEFQRKQAQKRYIPESLEDLQQMVSVTN